MKATFKVIKSHFSSVFGVIVLIGLLTSCAMMKIQETKDTEKLLTAAGFKMTLANSPAKMEHLKTLTQNKLVGHTKDGATYYIYADATNLVGHTKDGATYYIYADATNCQCFYWGSDQSYQSFLKLQEQQNLTAQDQMSAEMDTQEKLNWDTMGYGMSGD
ncbi:MAG: hypothetical protein RIQ94_1472, partial [Pseudomonadota bacterium]